MTIEKKCLNYQYYLLEPGMVEKKHFEILIEISPIRSQSVILALYNYFVEGRSRQHICEQFGVNSGYLSTKIRQVQDLNRKINEIAFNYYS